MHCPPRICVVFNPAARGEKARRFRSALERVAANCTLKPTRHPGHASDLAAEAVREGAEIVVAAGGDGTVNEVVDGLARDDSALARVRLGLIPIGTINVFARELGLPMDLEGAWEVVRAGHAVRVDLPQVDFSRDGKAARRRFAQLAGAGVDAFALERVDWELKKRLGSLAYGWAGLQALRTANPLVEAVCAEGRGAGQLVLIGNGRFYGGSLPMFPGGRLDNGRLEVRIMPRVGFQTITRFGWGWLWHRGFTVPGERRFQTACVRLSSDAKVPFELDGDLVAHLPAQFSIQPGALRVLAPSKT